MTDKGGCGLGYGKDGEVLFLLYLYGYTIFYNLKINFIEYGMLFLFVHP